MAQLIFEDLEGKIIEPSEDDLPYDVKGDKIMIGDSDFGVWYVDAYDHPELYLHIIRTTGHNLPNRNKHIFFHALRAKCLSRQRMICLMMLREIKL